MRFVPVLHQHREVWPLPSCKDEPSEHDIVHQKQHRCSPGAFLLKRTPNGNLSIALLHSDEIIMLDMVLNENEVCIDVGRSSMIEESTLSSVAVRASSSSDWYFIQSILTSFLSLALRGLNPGSGVSSG